MYSWVRWAECGWAGSGSVVREVVWKLAGLGWPSSDAGRLIGGSGMRVTGPRICHALTGLLGLVPMAIGSPREQAEPAKLSGPELELA